MGRIFEGTKGGGEGRGSFSFVAVFLFFLFLEDMWICDCIYDILENWGGVGVALIESAGAAYCLISFFSFAKYVLAVYMFRLHLLKV